jgi:hypothetical protein
MSAGGFHANSHIHPIFCNHSFHVIVGNDFFCPFPVPYAHNVLIPCTAASASRKGKQPLSPDSIPDKQKQARVEASPIPSITQQRAIHICNRVREFAVKLIEQLKQAHIEDNTVPPPTQFGNMKQDLPKRKYISVRSFATNPWMRGFAPPCLPVPVLPKC